MRKAMVNYEEDSGKLSGRRWQVMRKAVANYEEGGGML